jgi:hypothetical protein
MTEEEENPIEENGYKPFTDKSLNKALAILFVLALYIVIFLKILFIS